MGRFLLLALLLFCSAAQAGDKFSAFIVGLPTTSAPTGNEYVPLVASVNNPTKATVRSLLGVPGAVLSNLQGTTLSSPGLSATAWAGVAGKWSLGTAASPTATSGPLLQLSKTQQIPSASCGGNSLDVSCSAVVSAIVTGTASDGMQSTALFGYASTLSPNDAVGGFFMGVSKAGSTAIGTGFYAEGIADSGGGKALAGEFRTSNNNANGTYQSSGFSGTGGLWITAGGGFTSAEGIAIGAVNGQNYTVGVACKSGACGTNFLRDDSSSTASIQINGTHSYSIITGASAGFAGFGTQTPSANLHVSRAGNDGVQVFRISQAAQDYDFFRDTSTNALVIKNEATGSIAQFENSAGATQLTALQTGACVGCTSATAVLGELAFPKISASGSAPGAALLKIAAVVGTNANTCKLIAYAGTSTTPVTIVDNVGSGC